MSLFNRDQEESRTIDDILTPREEGCEDTEITSDDSNNLEEEVLDEVTEDVKIEIQTETPEESSFNALSCFGASDTKTPKWLIKCAHFWYGAMSFFWFIIGALTFAPIIFMQKKIKVIFKSKLKSLVVSCIIYAVFVALIVMLFASNRGANGTQMTAEMANKIANASKTLLSLDSPIF